MISPWLSAISALERRLSADQLTLNQYRAISFVHETENVLDDQLGMFITNNENCELGKSIANELFDCGYLEREGDTNFIILSDHGKMVVDEVYRLCHSRLTQPLFVPPAR
ncbi:MarR family transcriptional regulator [Vibrio crassostreae]|nr:conserved hypothetical protein [Vibrio chagasii]CAK2838819.1 MarR family transcriptional regulator [Vibrio crassostreae]